MALFLDTETTGLSPAAGDTIVEVAIVDEAGCILMDTLVNPRRPIPWQASNIHGILDDMVRGNVLGFSVLKVSALGNEPLEVAL